MDLLKLLNTIANFRRANKSSRAAYPLPNASYQPVLMLVLVRMFQLEPKKVALTEQGYVEYLECKKLFKKLHEKIFGKMNEKELPGKVCQPFWVFGAGKSIPKIWDLQPIPGKEKDLENELSRRKDPIKTETQLQKLVKNSKLVSGLVEVLNDPTAQEVIINFTVTRHFPNVRELVQDL